MELLVFSMTALLAAGAFVALRMVRLAAGRWWRWAGTAACAACGAALVAVAVLVLRRVDQVMSSRAASVEPEPLAATLASVAAVQDLWLFDTALFVVLGVVQGAALGLALSVITGPDAPVTGDAPARLEAWRSVLGKAVVALPLPAIAAVAFTFYQENRERFSSVEVGSFLRLALNPAPISGSQQSTPQGPSGDGRLFPTWTFVDRA